jgi:hypothetical protein
LQEKIMEKAYWLGRKRASLKSAQDANSSRARLAHYDLAGRYSVQAMSDETQAIDAAGAAPRSSQPAPGAAEEGYDDD